MTEEQKKKYEQDARVYHLSNCYRTSVRLENAFLAGAEHAHPIAHSEGKKEGWNEAIIKIGEMMVDKGYVFDLDMNALLSDIQKLRK